MRLERLRGEVEEAEDAARACAAVVDALAAVPGLLPSAYLERGGRLRCQAVRGYWQVRDGIPPGTGVIGECFRTGRPSIVTGDGMMHLRNGGDFALILFTERCDSLLVSAACDAAMERYADVLSPA